MIPSLLLPQEIRYLTSLALLRQKRPPPTTLALSRIRSLSTSSLPPPRTTCHFARPPTSRLGNRYELQRRSFHASSKREIALPALIWPLLGFLKVSSSRGLRRRIPPSLRSMILTLSSSSLLLQSSAMVTVIGTITRVAVSFLFVHYNPNLSFSFSLSQAINSRQTFSLQSSPSLRLSQIPQTPPSLRPFRPPSPSIPSQSLPTSLVDPLQLPSPFPLLPFIPDPDSRSFPLHVVVFQRVPPRPTSTPAGVAGRARPAEGVGEEGREVVQEEDDGDELDSGDAAGSGADLWVGRAGWV